MTRFAAPIAEQIWDMKYRLKDNQGKPIDITVEDTWRRIANALAQAEADYVPKSTGGHVPGAKERIAHYEEEFYSVLETFEFLPAGRIVAGAGSGRRVTLSNCYTMGVIPDSMEGIFSALKEAALTMQQGGGIGYDFSPIRPKGALVKKLGADASGPLTFMDVWDAMCRTVMSAGSRRGAMMATMRCDHPDIEDFIDAKHDPARLRMFNLSVLVTDDFMEAVKSDTEWHLMHREPPMVPVEGKEHVTEHFTAADGFPMFVHKTVRAKELWEKILRSTYDYAEPGVIFIDRVNRDHNIGYLETVTTTNPCGEKPMGPYASCLLGSINLARLIENAFRPNAGLDSDRLRKVVRIAIRMMDNVVDVGGFPLEAQREKAKQDRQLGLGVTGLADALAMVGLTYGSDAAVTRVDAWMKLIDEEAYRASVELAKEKGAFPTFDAEKFLSDGTHASRHDPRIKAAIREHGIRNALLTSIAPTGTISLYAGNVSSGVEPIFALSYKRKILQKDGTRTEERVEDYAVAEYRKFWNKNRTRPEDFNPDEHLPDYFVTAQSLKPMDHVKMQAAAQRWVDSSISKTINCPEDISFEDFQNVYLAAYESDCKGCTTYRPNEVTGSVLSVDEKPDPRREIPMEELVGAATKFLEKSPREDRKADLVALLEDLKIARVTEATSVEMQHRLMDLFVPPLQIEDDLTGKHFEFGGQVFTDKEALPRRPEALSGSTYKIKVGDRKAVYLTISDIEENGIVRPFEIFLRSSDPTHDEWMVALARMISAILRRPHSAAFVPDELKRIHSATSGGFWGQRGYMPSMVAAIGTKLKEHMEVGGMGHVAKVGSDAPIQTDVTGGPRCPECFSYNLRMESGCLTCADCGNSKCG